MRNGLTLALVLFMSLGVIGCETTNQRVLQSGNQVELRSMQTRTFDTADRN